MSHLSVYTSSPDLSHTFSNPTNILYFYNMCMLLYLTTSIVNKNYPGFYKQLAVGVAYNFIRLYSKAELFYKNNIKSLQINNTNEFITFIDNNTSVLVLEADEVLKLDKFPDCDFIIYQDAENNFSFSNELYEGSLECEVTDYTFMLIEVLVGEETYKLDLKTDDYNFYVVGNVFNQTIVCYLLKKFYDLDDVTQYHVKILDNNVESIEFDEQKSLSFKKDSYEIV
jgi:hypothetical protein